MTGQSLYVGSPETVTRKIANAVRTLGLDRFDPPGRRRDEARETEGGPRLLRHGLGREPQDRTVKPIGLAEVLGFLVVP